MDLDSQLDEAFSHLADLSEVVVFYSLPLPGGNKLPLILLWLAAAAIFFTIYLGFVNIRRFGHAFDVLRGKFDSSDKSDGQIGSFQALAAGLSGTVGLGNIAGVAVAVSTGGPGAIVWMILMGILGMSTKFVEIMLGIKYRHHPDKGNPEKISGGPMYYIRDGFANRNIRYVGSILAAFFAICCIGGALGGGNMFQANQAYVQLLNATGGPETSILAGKGWLFGLGLAFLTGLVTLGGIKSIGAVSAKIVPFMGGLYLLAGLVVIAMNAPQIPAGLMEILKGAFTPAAGWGGFLGGLLIGVQRAAFSNESGLGSAAIVHSAVKTDEPVAQGFVGMIGPFIDTVVICTVTALVIVFTGAHHDGNGIEGVSLTSRAFESAIPGSRYILALTVFLFAYSTLITWSYYGEKATLYLVGENRYFSLIYKIIFLIFIVIGSAASLGNVIRFSDAMILSLAIPNIIGLYILAPEVRRDMKGYEERILHEAPVIHPQENKKE